MYKRRNQRKNINDLILQHQLKNITLDGGSIDIPKPEQSKQVRFEETPKVVEPVVKLKKKGVPKDELINTKRLLTS